MKQRSNSRGWRWLAALAVIGVTASLLAPAASAASKTIQVTGAPYSWSVADGVADDNVGTVYASGINQKQIRYELVSAVDSGGATLAAKTFKIRKAKGTVAYNGGAIDGDSVTLTIRVYDKRGSRAKADPVTVTASVSVDRIIGSAAAGPAQAQIQGEGDSTQTPTDRYYGTVSAQCPLKDGYVNMGSADECNYVTLAQLAQRCADMWKGGKSVNGKSPWRTDWCRGIDFEPLIDWGDWVADELRCHRHTHLYVYPMFADEWPAGFKHNDFTLRSDKPWQAKYFRYDGQKYAWSHSHSNKLTLQGRQSECPEQTRNAIHEPHKIEKENEYETVYSARGRLIQQWKKDHSQTIDCDRQGGETNPCYGGSYHHPHG